MADQAGDAEVQQFHAMARIDDDVAGLDVGVNDTLAVGVVDRGADIDEQVQPGPESQAMGLDVVENGFAL